MSARGEEMNLSCLSLLARNEIFQLHKTALCEVMIQ